jgi:riboflavin synthase
MFTGIVEEVGIIKSITQGASSCQLTIGAKVVLQDVKTGDSINVNGICLTVTAFGPECFSADAMPETIRQTNFSALQPGSAVNLERALRLADRLGGHLVSGHIDGTGKILRRWEESNAVWFNISAPEKVLRYMADRGSVCLDGISLTVTTCDRKSFSVSIIPHTLEVTALKGKQAGDLLNIECDIIAKYVEKLHGSGSASSKIDMDFLSTNNFL